MPGLLPGFLLGKEVFTMLRSLAPKSVLCIHDLCGADRCCLGVILPVLAAMGCRPVALPTGLVSSRTGEEAPPAALNCQDFAAASLEQYRQLGREFDCIYVGCLGTEAQQKLVLDAFAAWPDAIKVVDPVMCAGSSELLPGLAALCRAADLTVPSLAEACQLLGRPLPEEPMTEEEAGAIAAEMAQHFEGTCVVSGIPVGKYLACAGAGQESFVQKRLMPQTYPGTGDLQTAVLVGGLMRGNALSAAADAAAGFVAAAMAATPADADPRLGVWYESQMYRLLP